jgi:FkbM family methyltransferase
VPIVIGFERASAELRALARGLGIMPHLSRARGVLQRLRGDTDYEVRFSRALMSQVRPGDVVWDIGANVGLYSLQLSEAVGTSGKVFAFEPMPSCFAALTQRSQGCANIQAIQAALGDRTGIAQITVDADELSTTNSLFVRGGAQTLDVRITTGDALVHSGEVPVPAVLKVDVEGFEEEVLRGLSQTLANPTCRALFCEVHFGILDARGERHAPSRIVQMLRDRGFKTRWIDASHLGAER